MRSTIFLVAAALLLLSVRAAPRAKRQLSPSASLFRDLGTYESIYNNKDMGTEVQKRQLGPSWTLQQRLKDLAGLYKRIPVVRKRQGSLGPSAALQELLSLMERLNGS